MSQQITFRPGQPQTFVATRSFDLGNTGLKLTRGDQVEFDGTQVLVLGHPPVAMPQMRGAIRVGWLVPAESFNQADTTAMRPVSAGVQVRAADGGNPLDHQSRTTITTQSVESEEREVTNVQAHAQRTAERNQTNYRRGAENRAVMAGTIEVEPQEGVPVRSLKTPAKQSTNLEKVSPFEAERQANSVKIEAGRGRTREEMIAQMSPEERAIYEQEIQSRKAQYDPTAPMVVGHVQSPGTQNREGMKVAGSVGGGVEVADMGGTGGEAQVTETVVEGIKVTNTNGPGTVKRTQAGPLPNGPDAQARAIAKSICPDFPENYVFADPVRKKIARLQADFDDRPDVIRAVAAADTDPEVRNRLFQEFPEAFGG